ncbi:MAG: hypothetical protein K0S32_1691 [Bacteroidetes bacterium]|jgi:hypothetical protein|nr:hypothetical protein [Bacteroidota bacterium]
MKLKLYKILFFAALLIAPAFSWSQHNHQHHNGKDTIKTKKENEHNHHEKQDEHEMPPMSHAFSLNLPMTRNGSGTGWLPDSTPMYGYMLHGKKWMYMFHGNIFARYNNQDIFNSGTRGDDKFDVINWFMAMGQRRVGKKGLFRFSGMISLDNLFGGNGYPLLFQTGESWKGKPLVDRQHPHDLFSELSVAYTHAINKNADVFIYAGYPGEPALGSVAFMHRVSSLYGPDAPLSHHWNDGTHITFGVITGGIRAGKFKIDISSFTGREPDENRYNFDTPRFDSYSGRLSFNPNPYWAFQVSHGFIKSPESVRPDENVNRTTVSGIYSRPLAKNNFLNATALWGLNNSHASEHAALLEAALVLNRFSMYGRYEMVQKSVHELNLNEELFGHDELFNINALTVGFGYDILRLKSLRIALGVQTSYYIPDPDLNLLYGKNPMSGQVFLRLYPPGMNVNRM